MPPTPVIIALVTNFILYVSVYVVALLRLQAVNKQIGGTIKSRSDLDLVRAAIQLNLYLGVPLVCCGALFMLIAYWLPWSWRLAFATAMVVWQILAWVIFKPMENQFKVLTVAPDQQELAIEYHSYVKQWAGATLRLK